MSMDEIYERMRSLHAGLEQFNDRLKASITEVNELHDRVNGLWQDSLRRDYDSRWIPLKESMDDYIAQIGPHYVESIQQRLSQTIQYLHGHER